VKTFILAAAFLGALSISAASAGTHLNLDISATDQQGHAVSTAKCAIDQNMDVAALDATWSCSFNGGASQSLDTVATYLSDATDSEPSHLAYDLMTGEDLGDFLYKGLNLTGAHDFNSLVIILGATPTTEFPALMVGADDYSHYYYLNMTVQAAAN
jgi:hypothetical protein